MSQSQIINLIHQRSRAAYKNAKDPKVKAQLQNQMDNLDYSPAEMKQQMGQYTQEDFERAEKLQKKGEEKLKKEAELEKKYEEQLKKERKKRFKKRYAFRGAPKTYSIDFNLFGKNVKFTPRDFLSGKFKQFGTATKPARDMFTKTFTKKLELITILKFFIFSN